MKQIKRPPDYYCVIDIDINGRANLFILDWIPVITLVNRCRFLGYFKWIRKKK